MLNGSRDIVCVCINIPKYRGEQTNSVPSYSLLGRQDIEYGFLHILVDLNKSSTILNVKYGGFCIFANF